MSGKQPLPSPRPLALLRDIERRYPGIWETAAYARAGKGNVEKGLDDWSPWCYMPLGVWFAVVEHLNGEHTDIQETVFIDGVRAAAAGTWRLGKGVYRFDPDLYAELIDTPISDEMPIDIFFRLPEYCVYVETPGLFFKGWAVYGFYAFLEEDIRDGSAELRLLYDCSHAYYPLILPLPEDWRFRSAFSKMYFDEANIKRMLKHMGHADTTREDIVLETRLLREFAAKTLSLLLYLCSDEPDYGDRTPPVPAAPKKIKGEIKWFQAIAVKNWDVGIRIGAAIRKYRQQVAERDNDGSSSARRSLRPHIRRAHWHGFWTGKRSDPLQRKFSLRWIPPITINIVEEEMPTVIHPVKNNKEGH